MEADTIEMECPHCEREGRIERARYVEGYRGRCPACGCLMSAAHKVAPAVVPAAAT